jgi:hypothetical protein
VGLFGRNGEKVTGSLRKLYVYAPGVEGGVEDVDPLISFYEPE